VDKTRRYLALIVVGILTGGYSILEIVMSRWLSSVSLLSDGIHNLSDVISLMIAFMALMKSTSRKKDEYTYGWKRTEILGAVMNGAFLLSLALYILIEAIPKFIVDECDDTSRLSKDYVYIITASAGLGINTLGTILFCILSGGHGHVHAGGGDHGHSHDGGHPHGEKKHKEKDHGHSHGDGEKKQPKEKGSHGHAHDAEKEGGHDHPPGEKKKHKEDGHGHAHAHEDKAAGGHDHPHGEKKKHNNMDIPTEAVKINQKSKTDMVILTAVKTRNIKKDMEKKSIKKTDMDIPTAVKRNINQRDI